MHTRSRRSLCALALLLAASACSQTPGEITHDSEPFDGIATQASITVLGTEPFWGLTIEPEGEAFTANYNNPENIEGTRFAVKRFAGNNGISFSGELEGEAVQLALTPGECSDGMSDRTYPYTATLAMGAVTLLGCAYTSDEPFAGDEAP